jgi:outer membrane protein insertion porin family
LGGLNYALAQLPTEPPVNQYPANAATPALGQPMPQQEQIPTPSEQPAGPPMQLPEDAVKPNQEMVVDVKVDGNHMVSRAKILPFIRTRKGRPYDQELVQEDVRRLSSCHLFSDAQAFQKKVEGGCIVYFQVVERPLLKEVLFVGCKEVNKRVLQKEADVKEGDAADPLAIEEARRKLEDFYHKRGFSRARVTLLEGDKREDRRAIFFINEDVKQKVNKVCFIGNTIASGDRLQTQIKSKHPFLYLFGGEFDRKQLEEDKERLTAYYRSLGFFRAKIGDPIIEPNEKGNWITITYVINEGIRYKVRNVSVIGNTKFSNKDLMADLKLKDTEYFDQGKLMTDVSTLQDKYGCVGYVFTDVKPENRFLEEPGQLDLVYNIKEGGRYRVGRIDIAIKGEYPHTMETTIRNRLSIYPGQLANIRKIRDSERRIKASGIFESKPGTEGPKIAYHPPGEGLEDETDKHTEVAEKPERPDGPPKFRSQSPDPQTHTTWYAPSGNSQEEPDRELIVQVDCGRYIGPKDPGRAEQFVSQRMAQATPAEVSTNQFASPTSTSQVLTNQVPTNQVATNQFVANPITTNQVATNQIAANQIPSNQVVSLADLQNNQPTSNTMDPFGKAMALLKGDSVKPCKASTTVQPQYVQYTPDGGVSTPTVQRPLLRWATSHSTSVGVTSNGTTTAQASDGTVIGNATTATTATQPTTQAATAQPSPQYAQQYPLNARQPLTVDPNGNLYPGPIFDPNSPFNGGPPDGGEQAVPLPFSVGAEEAMTGRIMLGVGVNSDSGLVGSATIDEQNFDWTRFPNSWEEIRNGTAFRGAGQRMRIEAVPGTSTSRYAVTFEEPYMFNMPITLGLSAYFYNRIYTEYEEQRLGGRISFGYQFTHDLTGTVAYNGAKINISDPIDAALPDLAAVVGRDLAMHDFQFTLTHDKRDNRFMATQGHLIEGSFERILGSYEYSRATVDLRKYFPMYHRPDGSGCHVLTLSSRVGWSSDNTPIYDRFYAGGYSTIRGFSFRGVSPLQIGPTDGAVIPVGGDFEVLASAEYMFPITADDMLRAVVFCDTGAVQPTISNWADKYRVAPGFGLRIAIPAMGPAPIALDFAFPVSWQSGDDKEVFSFFMGFTR